MKSREETSAFFFEAVHYRSNSLALRFDEGVNASKIPLDALLLVRDCVQICDPKSGEPNSVFRIGTLERDGPFASVTCQF